MKKDIKIPTAEKVSLAITRRKNNAGVYEWIASLLNENDFTLETVIINSWGEGEINGESKKTATVRKLFNSLEADKIARIEQLIPEVLKLNNHFRVSYFANGKMFEISFSFSPEELKEDRLMLISELGEVGMIKP